MSREKIVSKDELENYDPRKWDAVPLDDGTYRLTPVLWWDDASYARYQGDPVEDGVFGDYGGDDPPGAECDLHHEG